MSDILITWSLPATGPDQQAIAHVLLEISVNPEEVGWTEHRFVQPAAEQQVRMVDVAPGTHHYRLTVIDIDGRRSESVVVTATVAHRGPSPVENAQAVAS